MTESLLRRATVPLVALAERVRIERVLIWVAARRTHPVAMAVAVVAAMVFPLITLRGYHFEEGLAVALARDALFNGNWIAPEVYGHPFLERPVMLSWLIAVISVPFEAVTPVLARLPIAASLVAGALLVAGLTRLHASRTAAVFAAACFLFCPSVLGKVVTAESDLPLTVVQFAAFALWWRARRGGSGAHLRVLSWLAIGLLLAATAGFKGPQPAAFFALGVGAFILVRRAWTDVPGYLFAGVISLSIVVAWYAAVAARVDQVTMLAYMRLAISPELGDYFARRLSFLASVAWGLLPILFALPAMLSAALSVPFREHLAPRRELLLALVLYAGTAFLALAVWPGANARYAMPAVPALACAAGLVFDALLAGRPFVARSALTAVAVLVSYQAVWGWIVAPAAPDRFARSRLAAHTIEQVMHGRPGTIFAEFRHADPIRAYLDGPIVYLSPEELMQVEAPAWVLATVATSRTLSDTRPHLVVTAHATVFHNTELVFQSVRPRQSAN